MNTQQEQQFKEEDDACFDREFEASNSSPQMTETDDESDCGKMDGKSKHGKKRKGYSKDITKMLNDWFFANIQNPYPSEEEKKDLVLQTSLSLLQINNWFSNKRVRYKRKMQKEGQEVVEGGVDINQAFRSIRKQNKGEKKEGSSSPQATSPATTSSATPKRKRSTATKDSKKSKRSKETNVATKEGGETSVLTSLLESSSNNKNASTGGVVVLPHDNQMIVTTNVDTAVPVSSSERAVEEKTSSPDVSSPQPKKIDFFQSLQQAGVLFPPTTPAVIPVIPTYPYLVGAQYVDPSCFPQNTIPYSYPIYAHNPYYAPMMASKKVEDGCNYFELESGCIDESNQYEQADNSFGNDIFQDQDEGFFTDNSAHQWSSNPENDFLQFFSN